MQALQPPPAGAAPTADALYESFERHYAHTIGSLGPPYPGAARTLQRLREAGVQLAGVTNKEARLAQRLLEHHRLIGGDTLPFRKPHPGVLQHLTCCRRETRPQPDAADLCDGQALVALRARDGLTHGGWRRRPQ
jgi:phosphoglycolate phosphatase-like HAD superfamily hydrolase